MISIFSIQNIHNSLTWSPFQKNEEHTIIVPASCIGNQIMGVKYPNLNTLIYIPETIHKNNRVSLVFKNGDDLDIYRTISHIRERITDPKNHVKRTYYPEIPISKCANIYLVIIPKTTEEQCFQTISQSRIYYSFVPMSIITCASTRPTLNWKRKEVEAFTGLKMCYKV